MAEPTTRILVVDDEQHQLDTVCRGLTLYGYTCEGVLSADGAVYALENRDGAPFDLVITDLTMPGRSGLDLIEGIRRRMPELPILVITGLAASAETARVRELGLPLLPKPFDPDTLDAMVREALGETRGKELTPRERSRG